MRGETDFQGRNKTRGGYRTRPFLFFVSQITIPLPKISTIISTNLNNNVRITISNIYWVGKKCASTYWAVLKRTPILPILFRKSNPSYADLSPSRTRTCVGSCWSLQCDNILLNKPDGSILASFFMLTFLGVSQKNCICKHHYQFHSVSQQINMYWAFFTQKACGK